MSEAASTAAASRLRAPRQRGRVRGWVFVGYLLLSLLVGFATLGALLVDVFRRGFAFVDRALVFDVPSVDPAIAGARPAILGTIYLMVLVFAFSVPLGVGAALYLEEYANRERWYNRLLEVNIQNLAAVPSIIYGILGLAFIVRGPIGLGFVLLSGALILTLLVLPVVIIASREAVRAVPGSIREGGLALGATQWQVIWRSVLPAALPGMATGTILALSRAIGETAPLLLIGGLTYVAFNPTLLGPFTALPIQIYNWTAQPQEQFRLLAAGAIILLLAILLTMNALAIWLRTRYQKRW
jgi:phosphate transport system permease protein